MRLAGRAAAPAGPADPTPARFGVRPPRSEVSEPARLERSAGLPNLAIGPRRRPRLAAAAGRPCRAEPRAPLRQRARPSGHRPRRPIAVPEVLPRRTIRARLEKLVAEHLATGGAKARSQPPPREAG